MPGRFLELLRGLLRDEAGGESAAQRIDGAVESLSGAGQALEEELSAALERLSEQVNRCLEHRFLQSEWEERSRRARSGGGDALTTLALQAEQRAASHQHRVEECREAAVREEEVVRALERKLLELDLHLERIERERSILEATSSLASSGNRMRQAFECLRGATGVEFLEALESLRDRSERELALADLESQDAAPEARFAAPGAASKNPSRR
jgi:phage shock protein A